MIKTVWRGFMGMLPPFLRKPYILAALLFLVWMVFADNANLITQIRLIRSVNKLERDKTYYLDEIKKAEAEKKTLADDKETFAREKYFMQKNNEEVFILE